MTRKYTSGLPIWVDVCVRRGEFKRSKAALSALQRFGLLSFGLFVASSCASHGGVDHERAFAGTGGDGRADAGSSSESAGAGEPGNGASGSPAGGTGGPATVLGGAGAVATVPGGAGGVATVVGGAGGAGAILGGAGEVATVVGGAGGGSAEIGGGFGGSLAGFGGAQGGSGGETGRGGGVGDGDNPAGCLGAHPPRVRFVAPYVALANRPTTLIVRGKAFDVGEPLTLNIGATQVGPVVVDSDTQVTVHVPALPVGRYPVSVEGSNCSDAELVVLAPPALGYRVIKTTSVRERLIWDAERQTLYAVNRTNERIERYRYTAPDWTTLPPFVVPELTDIALSPNGRSLLVSSRRALSEVQLDQAPWVVVLRALNPDTSGCRAFFDTLSMTNDGAVFIISNLALCTGFSASYLYDMSAGSLTYSDLLNNGLAGGSPDGSRVYAGSRSGEEDPKIRTSG